MDQALKDSRILITEDKHFGQLVYARMQRTGGVIFIRFPARARRSLPVAVVELVRRRGESLIGNLPSSNQDARVPVESRGSEHMDPWYIWAGPPPLSALGLRGQETLRSIIAFRAGCKRTIIRTIIWMKGTHPRIWQQRLEPESRSVRSPTGILVSR
jgi:hypothetical protein